MRDETVVAFQDVRRALRRVSVRGERASVTTARRRGLLQAVAHRNQRLEKVWREKDAACAG